MAIVVEPTPYLNQRLEQLPEIQAARLWRELERANLRLQRLVQRIEVRQQSEPERRRLERIVLDAVARAWELRPEHLISADRYRRRVAARAQLVSLLHDRYGISYRAIARLLRRDRSTVAHAYRQHQLRMQAPPTLSMADDLGELDYATRYHQVLALCPSPSVN